MLHFCKSFSPTNHDILASASQLRKLLRYGMAFTPVFKKTGLSAILEDDDTSEDREKAPSTAFQSMDAVITQAIINGDKGVLSRLSSKDRSLVELYFSDDPDKDSILASLGHIYGFKIEEIGEVVNNIIQSLAA